MGDDSVEKMETQAFASNLIIGVILATANPLSMLR